MSTSERNTRKRIGLITICPEDDYQKRIMSGIFKKCEAYGYDVIVVTPLVQVANHFTNYLHGELNIYELINFDLFDGVIITPIPMTEDRIDSVVDRLLDKFRRECKVPVVSAGIAFGDYPVIATDDCGGFENITEHLINEHGCRDIAVLTGMKDYDLSYARINGVKKSMSRHGLTLPEERIFYGDFWYTSGQQLADDIISGKVSKPEAVICGSDAMAIGLVNRLIEGGIQVPGSIRVTGYDARSTAALNNPPITSYAPDDEDTGMRCVDYLHSVIEPASECLPIVRRPDGNLRRGTTCGCKEDLNYTRAKVVDSLYLANQEFRILSKRTGIDIGSLMESYTAEIFTSTESPKQCLGKIYESKYLLEPYGHFYICLTSGWLDSDAERTDGYPEFMLNVLRADMINNLHGYDYHIFMDRNNLKCFKTSEMLPELDKHFKEPQVFFFVPIHSHDKVLGYAVLQNDLKCENLPDITFRNYIRNINNALEMSRAKNRISNLSEHDMMTGLLNRRGMELRLNELTAKAAPDAAYFCCVIDMDGLKYMNDTYGHNIGDSGLLVIAEAAQSITSENELCVRGGGDEFYVVGTGQYSPADCEDKIRRFREFIAEHNASNRLPVPISASIGCSVSDGLGADAFSNAMEEADVQMYRDKRSRKSCR